MSDDEPTENISGGDAGGGAVAEFATGDGDTRAEAVVDALGDLYWRKAYGGQDAFECLVRTILSQNTSDKASQPAHDALMARYGGSETRSRSGADGSRDNETQSVSNHAAETRTGSEATREGDERAGADGDLAESLANAVRDDLAETISSAGLYNQKSETLIRLAGRVVEEYGGADGFDEFVRERDPGEVRDALLDMKGVGPKTADCVLLFAGGRGGVFPVDTHVHRIARRTGLAPPDADHEAVRAELEADVPAEKCGFGHTAMIQFGREYCSARTPACLDGPEACPLYGLCDRVGVDELSGDVVDPSEA